MLVLILFLLIDWANLFSLLFLISTYAVIIVMWLKTKDFFYFFQGLFSSIHSILKYCSLEFYFSLLHCLFLTGLFALIGSEFIYPETFPRVCCKLSVGHIQIGHTDLFPPQVCGRLWRWCRFGVQKFSYQFIAFPDLKYPSSSSFKPYFVYCWPVFISYTVSAFIGHKTCPWLC